MVFPTFMVQQFPDNSTIDKYVTILDKLLRNENLTKEERVEIIKLGVTSIVALFRAYPVRVSYEELHPAVRKKRYRR
jgi:hypothetical protein